MAGGAVDAAAGTVRGLLGLRLLDAHQRGVAQLVAAGLDGEQRRQRHVDVLEPAVFELALDAEPGAVFFTCMMMVACGMPSNSARTTPVWPRPDRRTAGR